MNSEAVTKVDLFLASVCEKCPVCNRARRRQEGAAFRFVTSVERRVCPFCIAYEKVHEKKAHEP